MNDPMVTILDKAHEATRIAHGKTDDPAVKDKLTYVMGLLESASEFIRPNEAEPEKWTDKVRKIVT